MVITARRTLPSTSSPESASLVPVSGLTTVAPSAAARSSMNALRRSPKNGAFTAATLTVLRIEFTTSVESASASTSSAMISSGLPDSTAFSSNGRRSWIALILSRFSRTWASSSTASMESLSVTK